MRFWLLLSLCLVNGPAMAGLFADEDARKQLQQLEARLYQLEKSLRNAEESNQQSVRTMLDQQMQIEVLNTEVRKLNGQNEELIHALQDAEKRQKDFYIDLDTRIRRMEAGDASESKSSANTGSGSAAPGGEKKALEAAYELYKAEKYQAAAEAFQEFVTRYPQSVQEANVRYWMGNAYFMVKDYKSSMLNYQQLVDKFSDHPRVPEAMLNIAECQIGLRNRTAARKVLKQVISQFPGSDASDRAKKRLAVIK